MVWEVLKFDTWFKRALMFSLGGHILFLSSVCLTFKSYSVVSKEMGVSFLGPLLAKADLSLWQADKSHYPVRFKTINAAKPGRKESINISSFSLKPVYPAGMVSSSVKHLDKFVVAEKKDNIAPVTRQELFTPPAWEKIKLSPKAE